VWKATDGATVASNVGGGCHQTVDIAGAQVNSIGHKLQETLAQEQKPKATRLIDIVEELLDYQPGAAGSASAGATTTASGFADDSEGVATNSSDSGAPSNYPPWYSSADISQFQRLLPSRVSSGAAAEQGLASIVGK
jgi:hypothetical protein